jgi:hypothetical protein
MKNRTHEPKKKNGKFFCLHQWEPCGKIGYNWDVTIGVSVPCKCTKCGREEPVPNFMIAEVPDDLINDMIQYR